MCWHCCFKVTRQHGATYTCILRVISHMASHHLSLSYSLSVFDEGRLTDGTGKTISCPNAIFIMTSNLVQDEIRDALDHGYHLRPNMSVLKHLDQTTKLLRQRGGVTTAPLEPTLEEMKKNKTNANGKLIPSSSAITTASETPSSSSSPPDDVTSELTKLSTDTEQFLRFIVHPILKRAFHRDEFLGRINDIIVFHPFNQTDLEETVKMELNRWAERAKERSERQEREEESGGIMRA